VIDTRAALAELIQHIDEFGDYDDIEATVDALRACGDRSLAPELTVALRRCLHERNFYGRDLIAAVLAGVQGADALPELLRASAVDLGDDQDSLDAEIVDLVKGDPVAARRAVLALAADPDPRLRRTGLGVLGLIAGPQDTDILLRAAADPDPEIRRTALGALPIGGTGDGGQTPAGRDRVFDALVTALRDADAHVRVTAVSQLGHQGRPEAAGHLAALVGDRADQVRQFAAIALGRIGGPATAPALLRLRTDRVRTVREAATEALGSAGGPQAVAALRAMAEDPDPEVRIEAAGALPKLGAEVLPLLTALATDPIPEVRAALISGLARAQPPAPDGFDTVVLTLADDPEHDVRRALATRVRLITPALAPSILRRYLDDPDLHAIAGRELSRLQS
jgi:HEAT repeat protein